MTTQLNAGSVNASSNAQVVVIDQRKGLHTIPKLLKSTGQIKLYYRHRATNEKLPDSGPGAADFEAKWSELEQRVGKEKVKGSTLAGLWDDRKDDPEYDQDCGSKSHRDNNDRIFRHFLAARATVEGKTYPAFGEWPIAALNDDEFFAAVYAYRKQLAKQRKEQGKGMREVDAHMTAICALFTWAVEVDKRLKVHPIGKYRKLYKSQRADVIFSMEQCATWLQEARKDPRTSAAMELVFLLALTLGQRAGDLRQLKWSDYIVDRVTGARGFEIWPLKTMDHNGRIFVPVLDEVGDFLDSMRGQPNEYILTFNGKPWKARTLSFYFGNITRAAKLFAEVEGKDAKGNRVKKLIALHMHDLRGTAITRLAMAGCTEQEIASITGHSTEYISKILKVYVKRNSRMAVNAINNLAKLPETIALMSAVRPQQSMPALTYAGPTLELQAAE